MPETVYRIYDFQTGRSWHTTDAIEAWRLSFDTERYDVEVLAYSY